VRLCLFAMLIPAHLRHHRGIKPRVRLREKGEQPPIHCPFRAPTSRDLLYGGEGRGGCLRCLRHQDDVIVFEGERTVRLWYYSYVQKGYLPPKK
jgi:hypothetical protein